MNIQEIKETFPDAEIRNGDLGRYAEIRLFPNVYLTVYSQEVATLLQVGNRIVDMPYVKTIEDVKTLYKLFNGET